MTDLEILKRYRTILVAKQFVVTGSFVLYHLGLIDQNSDLDIILIDPTPESLAMLQRLMEENPAKTSPKQDNGEVKYIFTHESRKIDIFIQDSPIDSKIYIDGIQANPLMNIIKAKKRFNRIKDIIQLRFLSTLFFKNEDLMKKIDVKNWKEVTSILDNEKEY